ncbi:hypothetical protein AVEN_167759-1 [Araneus ventricosus]|uniref:Uncharacterized protein n=1 Tax=Araneus ventricosus TaxID=182803 RepID=A0A4Y2PL42_ARAVE|nr:hypothetical protein AVEN_167759-1 [Araneus ventricosus]
MDPRQADKTTRLSRPFLRPAVNPIMTLTSTKHSADTTPRGSIVVNNTSPSRERARNLSDNLHSPNPISIRELLCPIDYGPDRNLPDSRRKTPPTDQVAIQFIPFPIYRPESFC